MEYPSTPKQFNLFQEYKNVEHEGNMLTADQRTKVYEDRFKVIAEMAESFYIFFQEYFLQPQRWQTSTLLVEINTSTISHRLCGNIDIFLQEDQLIAHKSWFFLGACSRLSPPTAMIWNRGMLTKISQNSVS